MPQNQFICYIRNIIAWARVILAFPFIKNMAFFFCFCSATTATVIKMSFVLKTKHPPRGISPQISPLYFNIILFKYYLLLACSQAWNVFPFDSFVLYSFDVYYFLLWFLGLIHQGVKGKTPQPIRLVMMMRISLRYVLIAIQKLEHL